MSAVPSIVLVDLASNEKHCLNFECILGRNWLKCDDKRISRNHGVLKVLSKTSISVQATHQNPIFFRKKDDTQINQIQQNQVVNLSVGDTFGLLVDLFWFCIQTYNENSELQMNGSSTIKRRTSSTLEPDSTTTKKVKTEPDDEFQLNADTTVVMSNGSANGLVTNTFEANATNNNQVPSTSSSSSVNSLMQNQTDMCSFHGPIKTEPIDLDENEAQPMQTADGVAIKIEPKIEHDCIHCPIKTEIKEEPAHHCDDVATSTNESLASSDNQAVAASNNQSVAASNNQTVDQQAERPTRRECCRYGVRCYRRNPAHRADEAHPGDTDYRLPDYPDPPLGTPQCPFLDRCYRRNPLHFQQFSHKTNLQDKKKDGFEATATEPNRTANRPNYANNGAAGADDDEEDDPYATDGDSDDDYNGPSSPESDDMPGFRNM